MRKLTVNDLQFSFTTDIDWHIKPMIKMKKVSFRKGKKYVSEFYGELVDFENMGLWLLLPAQEVVSFVTPNGDKKEKTYDQLVMDENGCLGWEEKNIYTYKKLRIEKARESIELKKADFFMGKCPVEILNPLRLQGSTAVIVKYNID